MRAVLWSQAMKKLGIVGSMGPESTIAYYRSIIAAGRTRGSVRRTRSARASMRRRTDVFLTFHVEHKLNFFADPHDDGICRSATAIGNDPATALAYHQRPQGLSVGS